MPQCKRAAEKAGFVRATGALEDPFTALQPLPGQFGTMKFPIRQIAGALGALAMVFSGPVALADASVAVPVHDAMEQTPHPALWKVADEDTTIYLFGTVHALPAGKAWFNPAIASALGSADQLVTEIDLAQSGAIAGEFAKKAMLPAGEGLRAMMTQEDRIAYEQALKSLGLPAEAFDRFKPWYAGLMLSMLPLLQHGYSPEAGVETVLAAHRAPRSTTAALETAEFQLGLFDSLTAAEQLSYLRSTVEAVPDMSATLNRMVDEWLEGDADALASLMNQQEDDPALMDRLLYSRNRTWADWIAKRLEQPGTVFMAVGAGHLAGPGSVQDELARRGIGSARVQ